MPRPTTEQAYGGVPAGLAGLGYEPVSGDITTNQSPRLMAGGVDYVGDHPTCEGTVKATGIRCTVAPTESGLCAGHQRQREAQARKDS